MVCDQVVPLSRAGMVSIVTSRHPEDHALACSGHEDAVLVLHVLPAARIVDPLPLGPLEIPRLPPAVFNPQIGIPADAHPVEFKTLDVKLSGRELKVVGSAHIPEWCQEPTCVVEIAIHDDAVPAKAPPP